MTRADIIGRARGQCRVRHQAPRASRRLARRLTMLAPESTQTEELLDEESLAVLAILLAVSLEFGFAFAKTIDWWAGLAAGPAALAALIGLFRVEHTDRLPVRLARWVVRPDQR
jgi:hypothetical protein